MLNLGLNEDYFRDRRKKLFQGKKLYLKENRASFFHLALKFDARM